MRDLLTILENLEEATKKDANAPQTLFANGLTPTQINKDPARWALLIQKISTNQPFVDNVTGDQIFIDPNEAKRLTKMKKDGAFKGEKTTILTKDGQEIPMSQLAKNEEFGGSTKESVLLKPSLIKITDRDIPATDLYEQIAGNQVLQSTDYGRVVIQLAQYIIAGEYCQLPPEYLEKAKESERKAIVDYAGEYLGVLALLYGRSRFPRKQQFLEWLGGDIGELTLNFPSAANNNIADSYAVIKNPNTSHSLNISSKGTGGGAAPAISGLKISPDIKRNTKLKNAVTLIELCQAGKDETGPSTIVQAFKIMDFLYSVSPNGVPKVWHKFLPFESKAPKLQQQCIASINSIKGQKNEKGIQSLRLPQVYQPLINDVNSEKASDGGKMVYKIKKTIAQLVNSKAVIPEFADTILQVLEMNFIQQYTDYHSNGEITFATQWPSKLEGVVSMENKSSAIEPSSAGFSFKLGRNASDYEEMGPDGPYIDVDTTPDIDIDEPEISQNVAEPDKVTKLSQRVKDGGNVGRSKQSVVKKR
jgi:hypothetical protein